jgi:membrane protease YdiL (CAAX protease family)
MPLSTNRRDLVALIMAIAVAGLMCPVTVALVRNPQQVWLYFVVAPGAVLSVWLCTRRWGQHCDSFGIRPPAKVWWHWIGLLLGVLMPFGLRPLWQTVGIPAFVPTVDIIPLISAVPAWEETAFRGIFLSAMLALLIGKTGAAQHRLFWKRALALMLSACVFSAGHMITLPSRMIWSSLGSIYFLDFFLSGLLFGFVRLRSQSLLPGMLMHSATNLVVWILIFQA